MVTPNTVRDYTQRKPAVGSRRHRKPRAEITFPTYLFDAIRKEAVKREKSFSAIVVQWLEAAYDLSAGE